MEFFDKQNGKGIFSIINGEEIYFTKVDIENISTKGYEYKDGEVVRTEKTNSIELVELELKIKQEKKETINKIATLSDQLNLLAGAIEILSEGNTDPRLDTARKVFADIKAELSK